jgi:hypothetical protein
MIVVRIKLIFLLDNIGKENKDFVKIVIRILGIRKLKNFLKLSLFISNSSVVVVDKENYFIH